jgi:Zn-dependent peptidase ImmA (M78 family)/DNA-binding XRE family transcriptional regulator
LQLAREAQGFTKVDLARNVGISAAAISQFEHGAARPAPSTLTRLGFALDVPVSFFAARPPLVHVAQTTEAFFRSLRSTPQLQRTKARARAVLVREIAAALERDVRMPPVTLPRDLFLPEEAARDDIEAAAAEARQALDVPRGPVANVVRLLESRGVVVSRIGTADERVSAFSQWIDSRPVVMLSSDQADAARSRFDAAHELGHLLLHAEPESGNAFLERQADAFASAFLMPAGDIARELPRRFSLGRFLELKQVWGVSISALLYRARTLGVMTESACRRSIIAMSAEFGRRNEPGDIGSAERALMLRRAAEMVDPADPIAYVARHVHLNVRTVREILDEPSTPAAELTALQLLGDPR